jgi:hypothetical protein
MGPALAQTCRIQLHQRGSGRAVGGGADRRQRRAFHRRPATARAWTCPGATAQSCSPLAMVQRPGRRLVDLPRRTLRRPCAVGDRCSVATVIGNRGPARRCGQPILGGLIANDPKVAAWEAIVTPRRAIVSPCRSRLRRHITGAAGRARARGGPLIQGRLCRMTGTVATRSIPADWYSLRPSGCHHRPADTRVPKRTVRISTTRATPTPRSGAFGRGFHAPLACCGRGAADHYVMLTPQVVQILAGSAERLHHHIHVGRSST